MATLIDARADCDIPTRPAGIDAAARRGLRYTPEVKRATDPLYERVKDFIPAMEWPLYAPLIHAINALKAERKAVILAHNYMTSEIFHCVGDFRGDSLQLAQEAARTDAEIIVQAGVHFMAETSKILAPEKTVLIPSLKAGCSLAASITGADVRLIKQRFPGVPIVTYVNTSADVKAESDICCTSSNALQVVESLPGDTVIMLPDEFLAKNVAAHTRKRIIAWHGRCEVHERFGLEEIAQLREGFPGAHILAHPECPPEVAAAADFVGSTAALAHYMAANKPGRVVLLTECSMSGNVAADNPDVEFIRPCNLCPHMKQITLENIYDALLHMQHEVLVDPDTIARAKGAITRMLALPRPTAPAAFKTGLALAEVEVI